MLKGLPPKRIAFQDVIYISRIRWEWSYGSVAFLSNSHNLSDLFAWEKKLFQSNWSLFGHKYSYDFRILNTESYFIIILKFKKYFKMLKYLKRNLTLSIITCHFYHHHYYLYYYYFCYRYYIGKIQITTWILPSTPHATLEKVLHNVTLYM